jgi:hypothetical protein
MAKSSRPLLQHLFQLRPLLQHPHLVCRKLKLLPKDHLRPMPNHRELCQGQPDTCQRHFGPSIQAYLMRSQLTGTSACWFTAQMRPPFCGPDLAIARNASQPRPLRVRGIPPLGQATFLPWGATQRLTPLGDSFGLRDEMWFSNEERSAVCLAVEIAVSRLQTFGVEPLDAGFLSADWVLDYD